ncbi:hypothetical protein [Planifilum fimeticola]
MIVHVGSVGALSSGAFQRAMAADHVQDNVRVDRACPGTTHTPAIEEKIRNAPDQGDEGDVCGRQPVGRPGTEKAAHAISLPVATRRSRSGHHPIDGR